MVRPKMDFNEDTYVVENPADASDHSESPRSEPSTPPRAISNGAAPIRRRNPPTIKIVTEAIKTLDEKKGSTYVAIKNWVTTNYPEVNRSKLKFMLTKALEKGVKEGKFLHVTSGSETEPVTSGRFKIESTGKALVAKSKKKTAVDDKTKKQRTKKAKDLSPDKELEVASDTEVEVVRAPKPRRRLSKSESDSPDVMVAAAANAKPKTAPKKKAAAKKTATTSAAKSKEKDPAESTASGAEKRKKTKKPTSAEP